MSFGGWAVFDLGDTRHVVPQEDLAVHINAKNCPCKPREDEREASVIIHNSFDERESYENGRKLQ